MKTRIWLRIAVGVITGLVFLGPLAANAQTEIKAVSFLPKDHKQCVMIPVWIERVNAALKGSIKVTWVGGPEVMAPFNQPEAVRKGIFQLGFMPAAYYGSLLPEADAISMSRLDFK